MSVSFDSTGFLGQTKHVTTGVYANSILDGRAGLERLFTFKTQSLVG